MNNEIELSHEDSLRLNVLICQNVNAIRINESNMMLYALLDEREVSIQLNPNCAESKYLKQVREFLAYQILGSPAGYPTFMKRWTRMGQARDTNLAELLKLAEPEAVVSVTHANGLTTTLAKHAWWCSQSVENARQMLHQENVAKSNFALELAEFLIEFLPFEEEGKNIIDTVHLVLSNELVNESTKQSLWRKGKRKASYLIGFILSSPDNLPDYAHCSPHENLDHFKNSSEFFDNVYHKQILRIYSAKGQYFLQTLERIILNFTDQDSIILLISAINQYFREINCEREAKNIDFEQFQNKNRDNLNLVHHQSVLRDLSLITEAKLTPILSRTNAVGTVLRRKLLPVTEPLLQQIRALQFANYSRE